MPSAAVDMAERASFLAASLALAWLWLLGPSYDHGGGWPRVAAYAHPVHVNLTQSRQHAEEMFDHGFANYMQHAYPKDDLRPISCRGRNSQGGIALTLIDSLDTLIVMGKQQELQDAVRKLSANTSFEVDQRVHVFELTIRAVGGLLSAHMLIELDPTLVPGYDGSLLRLAVDLTDRLLPAFDTPTGVPLSWVNLSKGQVVGDTRVTCTACAGTLLLEFGVLSRLTGNATYERKARRAVEMIHSMRSSRGLVGNTLDVDTGTWKRLDAGVGAGVDSYYEYLLKSYLAFGDEAYLNMFAEAYAAAVTHMQLSPTWNGFAWLMDVHMGTGQLLHAYVWSLGAFWPGLQVLAGQVSEAAGLHSNWTAAWNRWGWLPEMFEMSLDHRHPTQTGYPLRPELMESTYLLYTATRNPGLLGLGASLLQRLREKTHAKCGYASVRDVNTGQLEDTMESFFLSETSKYLYLLFANATGLVDFFVLSTEGHVFPPFPSPPTAPTESVLPEEGWVDAARGPRESAHSSSSTGSGSRASEGSQTRESRRERKWQQSLTQAVGSKCHWLCSAASEAASGLDDSAGGAGRVLSSMGSATAVLAAEEAALKKALPLLPLNPHAPVWLLERRCTACRAVTRAVITARRDQHGAGQQTASGQARAAAGAGAGAQEGPSGPQLVPRRGEQPSEAGGGATRALTGTGLPLLRQFICRLAVASPGKLGCASLEEVAAVSIGPRALDALPASSVIVQLTEGLAEDVVLVQMATVEATWGNGSTSYCEGQVAGFGPMFEPDCSPPADGGEGQGQQHPKKDMCVADPDTGYADPAAVSRRRSMQQQQETSAPMDRRDGVLYTAEGETDDYADPDEQEQEDAQPPSVCMVKGPAVAAVPLEACSRLENSRELQGAVAVVRRGECSFLDKVTVAEQAGAVGVIVINTLEEFMAMGGGEPGQQPGIPAVLLQRSTGQAILEALAARQAGKGSSSRTGSEAAGRVTLRLYAAAEAAGAEPAADLATEGLGQCSPEAEGQQDGMMHGQQDPRSSSGSGSGGDAAGDGEASAQQQAHSGPRLELLVPLKAQAYLLEKVYAQGNDLSLVFNEVLRHMMGRVEGADSSEDEGDDDVEPPRSVGQAGGATEHGQQQVGEGVQGNSGEGGSGSQGRRHVREASATEGADANAS